MDASTATRPTQVVAFGSAIQGGPRPPRDVDFMFTGDHSEAVVLAELWASTRGLGGLPVDLHRAEDVWGKGEIRIPTPYAVHDAYEVVHGDPKVVLVDKQDLPAAIRAYGDQPERLADLGPQAVSFDTTDLYGTTHIGNRRALAGALDRMAGCGLEALKVWPLLAALAAGEPAPGFHLGLRVDLGGGLRPVHLHYRGRYRRWTVRGALRRLYPPHRMQTLAVRATNWRRAAIGW